MDYSIETASAGELGDIEALLRQDKLGSWSVTSIRESLHQQGYCFRKICTGQKTAKNPSCAGYYFVQQIVDQLTLLAIFVTPQYRRQGFARAMLEDLIAFAKRSGCIDVLLEVRRSNHAAVGLYKALGFEQVGCRRSYYPAVPDAGATVEDALLFSLNLESRAGADHAFC